MELQAWNWMWSLFYTLLAYFVPPPPPCRPCLSHLRAPSGSPARGLGWAVSATAQLTWPTSPQGPRASGFLN